MAMMRSAHDGQRVKHVGTGALWRTSIRRLKDLVHALGTEGALDEVANGNGADESRETGILSLLLCGALLEDLGGAKRGLERGLGVWLVTVSLDRFPRCCTNQLAMMCEAAEILDRKVDVMGFTGG